MVSCRLASRVDMGYCDVYGYVRPQSVGFFSRFGHKLDIKFGYFGRKLGMSFALSLVLNCVCLLEEATLHLYR